MQSLLQGIAEYIALALEAASIVIVGLGGAEAIYRTLWPALRGRMTVGIGRVAWLGLARWMVLGLEFMLAADIVRTVIEPDWSELGQLGAIAVIRTFLNYFLVRDLESATHPLET